jgi:transcriptional regulator GlxA family with amidase domain
VAASRRQGSLPRPPAHREATVQLLAETYVRAQAVVERGYRRRLSLASVARLLAVSPRQLERAYDEIGLTTFGAHLRTVRLRNAADLLAHQPLTVTDVARLVGYRQPSHFVKAFRRRYGTTPGAYRDLMRREIPRRVPGSENWCEGRTDTRRTATQIAPTTTPHTADADERG